MKTGEKLHGFTVRSERFIEECGSTLYFLEHEKHGTPLIFFDRADNNKTFYIAFKTLPYDDTGVFHIIEHSVLCGSRKFPVKEPFVELLKSSLKTFLNAITYPDATVYPVSSRSDRDFLNLTDVYMDAVFHPLMLENESIFMQEGHRLEIDENGRASINGVVYNEMKGAMSSKDDISDSYLTKLLYPDSVYSKNSGGAPEAIPTLTYEAFCAAHKKFYHPDNAYIFLDGTVKLDEVLPLLDSYLSEFEIRGEVIKNEEGTPIEAKRAVGYYEVSDEDELENKTCFYLGMRTCGIEDSELNFELDVLFDAIAGSNEAPLTRALLDAELAEDLVDFSVGHGAWALEILNANEADEEKIYELIFKKLRELREDGIGRDILEAALNSREFALRENDNGSSPEGLANGLSILNLWLNGCNPASALEYEKILSAAREKLDGDFYESLIDRFILSSNECVRLKLLPSATLGEELDREEKKRAKRMYESMSEAQKDLLKKKTAAFESWQSTPDSDEKLNTLPTLTLSDIPKMDELAKTELRRFDEGEVILHDVATGGISYVTMHFDVSDLDREELSLLSLLTSLLGQCATEKYSAVELITKTGAELGSLYTSATFLQKNDGRVVPYLYLFASALDRKRDALVEIISEILLKTKFDKRTVSTVINQKITSMKNGFSSSGHIAAMTRSRAYVSSLGMIRECFSGLEMFKFLKNAADEVTNDFSSFEKRVDGFVKRIVDKGRLTISVSGTSCDGLAKALLSLPMPSSPAPAAREIEPLGKKNEGVVIPSRVSYMSRTASLAAAEVSFSGSMHVLSHILSYTHLWNEVRVRGGAYGVGFSISRTGICGIYSYRDPSPDSSVAVCDTMPAFLRKTVEDGESLDNYIIGTFGSYDSLTSVRSRCTTATSRYIMGITKEDLLKVREEMRETDGEELLRLAAVVEKLMDNSAVCIFGPKEQLAKCKDLKEIIEI